MIDCAGPPAPVEPVFESIGKRARGARPEQMHFKRERTLEFGEPKQGHSNSIRVHGFISYFAPLRIWRGCQHNRDSGAVEGAVLRTKKNRPMSLVVAATTAACYHSLHFVRNCSVRSDESCCRP